MALVGAAEMLMATAVSRLAENTPGKESVAIESFARALRQVFESLVASELVTANLSLLVTNDHR